MQNFSVESISQKAEYRNKDYWAMIIKEWQEGEERQRTFCAKKGIKFTTFSYWRTVFTKQNEGSESKRFIPVSGYSFPRIANFKPQAGSEERGDKQIRIL